MSTINASNFGDGTSSVPASAVLEGTAKAWCNLNGTGTIAVRRSHNISSVTDVSGGTYTMALTNAFAYSDYAVETSADNPQHKGNNSGANTASEVAYETRNSAGGTADAAFAMFAAHGDLA